MPIRLNIEIRGMQELQRQLDDFPRMLQRKILRRALRLGANVVRDKARAMVSVRSGKLKRSIRSGVTKDLRAIVSAGRNKKKDDPFYALFIERGTKPHIIKSKKGRRGVLKIGNLFVSGKVQHPGALPTHFLADALEASREKALEAIAEELRTQLDSGPL